MAAADLILRQGDTTPALTATIVDQNGTAVNLTGASVQFIMRALTSAAPTVNATASIVSPSAGTVQYLWAAADTATAGLYQGLFRVTLSGGGTYTYPNDGYLDIWVEPNLTSDTGQYLLSLPDMKDELNIQAADRSHDQKLVRWVMAAAPVIELVTGPIVTRTYDEWYKGGNYFIHLRHRPCTLLVACSIFMGPVEYPMSIVQDPAHGSIYSVMADPNGDQIVRRAPGGAVMAFPDGPDAVHVVYQAGRPSVPENVRQAALEMLRENWLASQTPGGPRTGGEAAQGPDSEIGAMPIPYLMSDRVRSWLGPNRRHPSVA